MSLAKIHQEDRRLCILIILLQVNGFAVNEVMMREVLSKAYGHLVGRDLLHTELAWLQEQGLLSVDEIAGTQLAKLTGRGADVANGAAIVPGVKRPEPGI